jgi:hypothetical protein
MDQDCLQSLSCFSGANQEGMRQRFFPNRIRPRLADPEYNVKSRTIKIFVRKSASRSDAPFDHFGARSPNR